MSEMFSQPPQYDDESNVDNAFVEELRRRQGSVQSNPDINQRLPVRADEHEVPQPMWLTGHPEENNASEREGRFVLFPEDDDEDAPRKPDLPRRSGRSLVDGDAPSAFLDAPASDLDDPDAFGGGWRDHRPVSAPRAPMPMAAAGSGDPDPRHPWDDDRHVPVARRRSAEDDPDDYPDEEDHTETAAPKERRFKKRKIAAYTVAAGGLLWLGSCLGGGGDLGDTRDGKQTTPDIGCTDIAAQRKSAVEDRVKYDYRASAIEKNGAEISRVEYRIDHPSPSKDTKVTDTKPFKGFSTNFTPNKHTIYATVHGKTREGQAIKADCKPLELIVRSNIGQETGN